MPKDVDIPIPVRPLILCRALHRAPITAQGAVLSLMLSWWFKGCPPLPTVDADLQVMCGASTPQWRKVRSVVLAAVEELSPTMTDSYRRLHRLLMQRSAYATAAAHISNEKQRATANALRLKPIADTSPVAARSLPAIHAREGTQGAVLGREGREIAARALKVRMGHAGAAPLMSDAPS